MLTTGISDAGGANAELLSKKLLTSVDMRNIIGAIQKDFEKCAIQLEEAELLELCEIAQQVSLAVDVAVKKLSTRKSLFAMD